MEIVSFAQYGYEGEIVKIEADLRRGIPAIDIVGLPDGAIREARERMRAAIRNSGLEFPRERILINLSPASLKKEGSGFDLPIALAVLMAAGCEAGTGGCEAGTGGGEPRTLRIMVLGELELSGTVRGVRGILPAVSKGLQEGIRCFLVPEENEREASILRGALVIGVATLTEAFHRLLALGSESAPDPQNPNAAGSSEIKIRSVRRKADGADGADCTEEAGEPIWPDSGEIDGLEDVRGQPKLVRALEIAAAGGHNLIAYGPPGCGKTLALRRFPSLLPNLERDTAIEVTRIYSLAGMRQAAGDSGIGEALARRPPFREPGQSASLEGMTGGGVIYRNKCDFIEINATNASIFDS